MSENVEFIDHQEEQKEIRKGSFRDFIDGNILVRDFVIRQFGFFLFLTFLALLYIANRYHAERVVRDTSELKKEIRELRSESISVGAELMYKSSQSEVLEMIKDKNLGLEESKTPPFKIIVHKK
ncbi:MAG: hypothetical protein GXO83_11120 [Chlorobi bacterium]|nr:hypothetical protein [Chlorobiota bacterium]